MNKTMTQISQATKQALDTGNGQNISRLYQVIVDDDGTVSAKYRGTRVAQFYTDGTIRLYTHGYHTLTTKNVINAALFGARSPFSVYQSDFAWYVHNRADGDAWSTKTDQQFTDNMVLDPKPAALSVA